jgi:hypothetical protein
LLLLPFAFAFTCRYRIRRIFHRALAVASRQSWASAQRLAAAQRPPTLPEGGVKPTGRNDRIIAVVFALAFALVFFFLAFFAQKSHVKPQKHLNLYQ